MGAQGLVLRAGQGPQMQYGLWTDPGQTGHPDTPIGGCPSVRFFCPVLLSCSDIPDITCLSAVSGVSGIS
jgi:hypothetical protein